MCNFRFEADMDPWLEWVCLLWGEHWLPDVIAELEDGVAERDLDEIFADFAAQLDPYFAPACQPVGPVPHRNGHVAGPTKHPKATSQVCHTVRRAFADQVQWQQHVRQMALIDPPATQPTPKLQLPDGRQVFFLVVHLFSGRRRPGDVQHHLQSMAQGCGLPLLILSLDTAVTLEFGNLSLDTPSWRTLEQLYAAGFVAPTLVGSPCETFSEARFNRPPDADDSRPWPRPLRSAERLLGLEGLTFKELKQVHMGGNFFQQAVLALSYRMARVALSLSTPQSPMHLNVLVSGPAHCLRFFSNIPMLL